MDEKNKNYFSLAGKFLIASPNISDPRFSQTLINLKVDDPNKIILSDQFWSKVTQIEKTLGDQGRVLIRPSGTEPLIRLMVESTDTSISENFCNSLAELALEI